MAFFGKRYNQSPLSIDTFDGSRSPYHPSVKYFPGGWCGYEWWMAQTPFPVNALPYRDRWECPQIHVSHDGLHWKPANGARPIDDLTAEQIADGDYFSDPHLVMTPRGMECWYRLTRRHGTEDKSDVALVRRVSADGLRWSGREEMVRPAVMPAHPLGDMIVSQAVEYGEACGEYVMWWVDSETAGQRGVRMSRSADGLAWCPFTQCAFHGREVNPWHIDVTHDSDGTFLLVCYDYRDITLWRSTDGVNWHYVTLMLVAGLCKGSFYYDLYRASLVDAGPEGWRLYFSASDLRRRYIGVMEGCRPEAMAVVSVDNRPFRTLPGALLKEYLPRAVRSVMFRLRRR